ncbi:universal stress protein [Poseidonocella sedimentorum]|uniref:Nucleotide-binding universal stress protein, UspA family n=1 Tax=Poseidonocella sedimentorum TaxID=871652 RepID=A0A1I6DDZ9_9RHOB|nr:universal stress protein [Poseidonocella sedimentorum]SFR03679.1 Nucleotide-binding universal stress protein, UspA family [Poseidonocella sedimentorum]
MFNKILLPIDLEEEQSWAKALPMAQRLAGESGTVHLLGIVHDVGSALVAGFLPEGYEREALSKMQRRLLEFAKDHGAEGRIEAHTGHGHVPEVILRQAKKTGAELIVMASHSPDDLRTYLVGSHADKVVHNAKIPVLVMR